MEKEMAMEPAEAPRQKNRILMAIVGVVMTLAMLFSIGATLPAQTVNAGPIGGILVAADERRTTISCMTRSFRSSLPSREPTGICFGLPMP